MSFAVRRRNTLIMLVVGAIACALAPLNPVWLDTVILTGVLALISLSAGLSFGQAGILSMAQGAFAAIGAYATAYLATKFGLSAWVGLSLAITLPAALAWALARMVTRMPELATALATLALATLLEIVARNWDAVTGGYVGIAGVPPIGGFRAMRPCDPCGATSTHRYSPSGPKRMSLRNSKPSFSV